jgi:hypothetical protein
MNNGPSCRDCLDVGKSRTAVKFFRADKIDEYTLLVPLCVEHHKKRVAARDAAALARERAAHAQRRRKLGR